MFNESDLMDYLIDLRSNASVYALQHKTLYYRQSLIYFSLIFCRILTVAQMKILLDFEEEQDNILRKHVSAFCARGEVIRESFNYNDRYATYSLSKAGLAWAITQLPLIKKLSITEASLCEIYRKRKRDKPSNHLVCTNHIKLSLLCAGSNALHIQPEHERPFLINHTTQPLHRQKNAGQIVPDLFFEFQNIPVYLEADTTSVRFDAAKGPGEKISKYTMLCDPSQKSKTCCHAHLLFSVQKHWGELEDSNGILTKQESELFGNPDKTNQAVSIIRLVSGLYNAYQTPKLTTLEDVLLYLQNSAPMLENQLIRGPLLCNTSLLLHCLISHGFGDCRIGEIRRCITLITRQVQEDIKNQKLNAALKASEKRKKELFHRILSSKHIKYGCEHGISISCACGYMLHRELPALLPALYYPEDRMEHVLKNCGILSGSDHFLRFIPSMPCRYWSGDDNHKLLQYDTILNNAYLFKLENGKILTVFFENVSDDIGGYLRARKYLMLPPGFLKNTLLLLIIRDDLILADGCSVWMGGLYYDVERAVIPHFTDSVTGEVNKTPLQALNHYISQCRELALPYLFEHTQDYAFLTYKDFQIANFRSVIPVAYVPGRNDIINRKSDPLSHFNPCNYELPDSINYRRTDFSLFTK